MADLFYFGNDMQDLLLACLSTHRSEFTVVGPLIKPEYMWGLNATRVTDAMQQYHDKQGIYPTLTAVDGWLQEKYGRDKADVYAEVHEYIQKLRGIDTADWKWVKEVTTKFCKERALIVAIKKAADMVREDKVPDGGFTKMFDEAMAVGRDLSDLGISFIGSMEHVVAQATDEKWGTKTGYNLLDKIWPNGWGPGWLVVPLAPPKSYKCFGKGTGIMMFDGSVKPVETIIAGDLVMGDDSTPRRVLTSGCGVGPLFSVQQANGDDFVCNDAHVLCTKNIKGQLREICAEAYADSAPWFKRQWKGYKAGIDFTKQDLPLDPYFIGLWLGDGSTNYSDITVAKKDPAIDRWLRDYASSYAMRVTPQMSRGSACFRFVLSEKRSAVCSVPGCGQKQRTGGFCQHHYNHAHYHAGFRVHPAGQSRPNNPLNSGLKNLGILHDKHIPDSCKFNDRTTRLKLLAGLLDSDGHRAKYRFIFVNANEQLAKDVCWLARSLGFLVNIAAYASSNQNPTFTGTAWHVSITGKLSEIPTLLARKRASDSVRRSGSRYAIRTKTIGVGDYYGFTVDGNNRFLLADFTVTHNSTFCINLALRMAKKGTNQEMCPVFYYACEISAELSALRGYSIVSGVAPNDMHKSPEMFIQKTKTGLGAWFAEEDGFYGQILLKGYAAKTASIADIRAHALAAIEAFGVRPKAIVIDHAETVKIGKRTEEASDHRSQADIYTEAKALGQELGCIVIMPDRCNKETVQQTTPSMTSFQGSFEKAGIVDVAIGLCQTDIERVNNTIRYFVFLNRHGPQYDYFEGTVGKDRFSMTIDKDLDYVKAVECEASLKNNRETRRLSASHIGQLDHQWSDVCMT